jgi:hypothetical protein
MYFDIEFQYNININKDPEEMMELFKKVRRLRGNFDPRMNRAG